MRKSARRAEFGFLLVLTLMLTAVPMFGAAAVVGSVAGSTNATVGDRTLAPNTTVFSGDSLQVKDGSAVVALEKGSLMVLGRETLASFDRAADQVTISLTRGSVSMYHPAEGVALRVKVGPVSVLSGSGFKTQGDVAMVNGIIVVSAKEGALRVEAPGQSLEVKKGKTVTLKQIAGRAPSGQVGAAGGAAAIGSHLAVPIAVAATAVTGGIFTVVAVNKTSNANDAANTAATTAASAANDAASAQAAANSAATDAAASQAAAAAAAAAASAACKAVSQSDPGCTPH